MARRFGDGIGKFLTELVDPRPAISDAYWAFTHPRDRIMGRGRAANSQMAFPFGGRWTPKTPGIVEETDRLQRVFDRRFNPEREKVLRSVEKAKIPPKKSRVETQLDRDIRKLRLEAENARFQVTNRDIGHPLTPVRRPVQPRPPKPVQLTPVQQQARLGAELRQRRRGGV